MNIGYVYEGIFPRSEPGNALSGNNQWNPHAALVQGALAVSVGIVLQYVSGRAVIAYEDDERIVSHALLQSTEHPAYLEI